MMTRPVTHCLQAAKCPDHRTLGGRQCVLCKSCCSVQPEHRGAEGLGNTRANSNSDCKALKGICHDLWFWNGESALLSVLLLWRRRSTPAWRSRPKQPRIETGPDAEVTHDGLIGSKGASSTRRGSKPDLDLTPYKKLMVVSQALLSGRSNRSAIFKRASSRSSRSRKKTSKAVRYLQTAFEIELAKLERYEIVEAPGPDVLLVVGTVIDVVSDVPPDWICEIRPRRLYLTSVGDATRVIELRDSEAARFLPARRIGAPPNRPSHSR